MRPTIDPEIRDLLRPLTEEEFAQLRASIEREGCREALVVWKGHGVLLDGHNRLRACEETGREYRTVEVDLPDRRAVLEWVIDNQLSRRNLSVPEHRYLIGKRHELAKRDDAANLNRGSEAGIQGAEPDSPGGKTCHPGTKTRSAVAADAGVSSRTVQNAARYSRAIDAITTRVGGGVKLALLRGDFHLSFEQVEVLAARDDVTTLDQVRAYAEECRALRAPRPTKSDSPYTQRSVHGVITTIDTETGIERVDRYVLSCGHEELAKREVSLETKRKTVPCTQCGSGTRAPHDKRRLEREWKFAFERACGTPVRRTALSQLARAALLLAGLRPMDARATALRAEIQEHALTAGLLPAQTSAAADEAAG